MATYQTINLTDFMDAIKPEKGWYAVHAANCKERVFEWAFPQAPEIKLRVYSSIPSDADTTRKVGSDAIRVCAVKIVNDVTQGYVKSKRVHRVAGWYDNLRARLLDVYNQAKDRLVYDCIYEAEVEGFTASNDFMTACPDNIRKYKGSTVAWVRDRATNENDVAIQILKKIYAMQTEAEQASGQTIEDNGVGFSGCDAEFMTSLCDQYEKYGQMSDKQWAYARKSAKRYAKQFCGLMPH